MGPPAAQRGRLTAAERRPEPARPAWRCEAGAGVLIGRRSGAAAGILGARVPPVLPEFAVMKPAEQVGVVIQLVGRGLHLVKVVPVIAGRRFLLRALADNAQFFPA